MGLPYQSEDYDGGGGSASTINDLGGMNFSTLDNNELMKKVDANNVGGSGITSVETTIGASYNNQIKTFVGSNELASITTAYNSIGNYKNMQLKPDNSIIGANGVNIQSVPASTDTRIGINVQDPEEALDIEGNIELRGASGKIFFKHPSGLQKVELDGDQDGTNGGKFIVKTKEDNGNMTQKLEINNDGATTISGVLSANGLKTDNPIHMGTNSGVINQSIDAVAIGLLAGNDTQGTISVAIGRGAGQTNQGGGCVAIGNNAGNSNQSNGNGYAVAIGWEAGQTNQGEKTFAMGVRAGNSNQGAGSFALGEQAGETGQGASCIAIGKQAGETNQHDNTIVLNAQGTPLNTTATNGFYVAPIANASTANHLYYDTTTKQITYAPLTGSITAPTFKTTALPTLPNEIGYYQVKTVPAGITIPVFSNNVLLTFFDLPEGVHNVKCAFTVDRQGPGSSPPYANYGSTAILNEGFAGPVLTENFTVVVDGGFTTNYVNDTVVVPYGTTLRVEFRAYVGTNALSVIQTSFPTKCSAVRIA